MAGTYRLQQLLSLSLYIKQSIKSCLSEWRHRLANTLRTCTATTVQQGLGIGVEVCEKWLARYAENSNSIYSRNSISYPWIYNLFNLLPWCFITQAQVFRRGNDPTTTMKHIHVGAIKKLSKTEAAVRCRRAERFALEVDCLIYSLGTLLGGSMLLMK